MDPLDHLGGQDGGQLIGHPGRELTSWVGVRHIAQGAGGPAQGSDQEPCQGDLSQMKSE